MDKITPIDVEEKQDPCDHCQSGELLKCSDLCKVNLNDLPIPHEHECRLCGRKTTVGSIKFEI